MPPRNRVITREEAEMMAIEGLQFIASDAHEMNRFLALTGIAPSEIRDAATSDVFLSGVLDYLLGDEATLIAFATARGRDPAEIAVARQVLSRDHSTE